MGSLRVKDASEKYRKDHKWRYLIHSGSSEGTDRFFAAVLEMTPRDGLLFAGVENQVRILGIIVLFWFFSFLLIHFFQLQVKISTVSAVVTRETFVRLLDITRLLSDIISKRPKKAKPQLASLPSISPTPAGTWTQAKSQKKREREQAQAQAQAQAERAALIDNFFVLARVRAEIDRVEVRLNRNGTELLYAALEKIGASAEAFSDNTVMLAGELAGFVVRDSQRPGSLWTDIVQIKQNVPHSFTNPELLRNPSQALLNWPSGSAVGQPQSQPAPQPPLSRQSSSMLGGGGGPTKPVFEHGNLLASCTNLLAAMPAAQEQPLVEWALNTYKSRFDNDFGADASIGILINSVRFVVVWRLMCELLEYVDVPFIFLPQLTIDCLKIREGV